MNFSHWHNLVIDIINDNFIEEDFWMLPWTLVIDTIIDNFIAEDFCMLPWSLVIDTIIDNFDAHENFLEIFEDEVAIF